MKRLQAEAPLHACQISAILGIARRHLREDFSRMSNPDRRDAAMSAERLDDCLIEGAELQGSERSVPVSYLCRRYKEEPRGQGHLSSCSVD